MDFSIADIRILDVVDILIVAYLIYLVYKLLRGTLAFNIFIGVVLVYSLYLVVRWLDMELLSLVLGKFVGFGVLFLVIIFQPEVRRFLLMLGNSTLKGRLKFIDRIFGKKNGEIAYENEHVALEIMKAAKNLSKTQTGGLIIITDDFIWQNYAHSGVELKAQISSALLESIFFKGSPLHDGAVIISGDQIKAASCALSVGGKGDLPSEYGLRHRAGVGVTSDSGALALIISEETGAISFATSGKLSPYTTDKILKEALLSRLH